MIHYNLPLPADIEVLLKGIPAPFDPEPPSSIFMKQELKLSVYCGRTVRKEFVLVDLPSTFYVSHLTVDCKHPRFYLHLVLIRRNFGTWRFRFRLPYTRSVNGFAVDLSGPRVREWHKSRRSTVSRKKKPRKKRTRQRTIRPNPEVKTGLYTFFIQRGSTVTTNTVTPIDLYKREWTGTTTPGFRALKRRFLPVNPHSVDLRTNKDGGFVEVLTDEIDPENGQVFISSWQAGFGAWTSSPPSLSHLDGVENKAIQRLVDKMGSAIEGNIAQDAAQFGQLSGLITSAVGRMTGSLKALRRKDFLGAADALWNGTHRSPRYRTSSTPTISGSFAKNWLELQYGWKPLLTDIHGALQSLASFYNLTEHVTRTVTASARKEDITRSDIFDGSNHQTVVGQGENSVTTRVRYSLRYKIDSRLKAYLAQTGFTNPINLVWEVLPYSFVLDWLLPVGGYLESITSYDGLEFVDGCKTTFSKQRYIGIINFSGRYGSALPWQRFNTYGTYRRERILLSREKLTAFPHQNLPRLKNPFSVEHSLNALALLHEAFRR